MTATVWRRPGAGAAQLCRHRALLRFALRRDRRRLAIWVLAVGGMTVYAAVGLGAVYPTAADRQARAAVIGNPAASCSAAPATAPTTTRSAR